MLHISLKLWCLHDMWIWVVTIRYQCPRLICFTSKIEMTCRVLKMCMMTSILIFERLKIYWKLLSLHSLSCILDFVKILFLLSYLSQMMRTRAFMIEYQELVSALINRYIEWGSFIGEVTLEVVFIKYKVASRMKGMMHFIDYNVIIYRLWTTSTTTR